jgi:two-component system LytT family response regulator
MRVLVVDDEAAGRRKVLRFLREHADVEIAGECANGLEAVDRVRNERPEIVFLDIQMPDMDGFEVVEALATGDYLPAIVFATAHDEFAVRAFEVNAVDYLLKPFDRERFDRAFDRALDRARKTAGISNVAGQDRLLNLLDAIRPAGQYLRRVLVPTENRSLFVNIGEIFRFEAERNNVVIYSRRGTFTIRTTLESLEQKLDPQQFARIHRSHVVNLDAIKEIHPWFHGDYKVVLHGGTELMWSRRYTAKRPDLLP